MSFLSLFLFLIDVINAQSLRCFKLSLVFMDSKMQVSVSYIQIFIVINIGGGGVEGRRVGDVVIKR